MIPSAKMVKRDNAPPENILNMPRMPFFCDLNKSASTVGSMPGTGIWAPMRNTTNAPSKNQRRWLKSPYFPLLTPLVTVLTYNLLSDAAASCFNRCACTFCCQQALQLHSAGNFTAQNHLRSQRHGRNDARLF